MIKVSSNRIMLCVALLIGAVSTYLIYRGVQTLGSSDYTISLMYIGAGVGGFLVTGYQYRKMMRASKDVVDSVKVYTTLECAKCDKRTERPFLRGDYIYKTAGSCGDCSGPLVITKITAPEAEHQKGRHPNN